MVRSVGIRWAASLLLAALFAVWPCGSFAAVITWGAASTISGDADVSTNGVLLYAYDDSAVAATVSAVAFAPGNSASSLGGDVSIGGAFSFTTTAYGSASATPWTILSTNYRAVLQGGVYSTNNGTLTVTLNNLVAGRSYLVQVWASDNRALASNRTETVASSGGNNVTLDYNSTGTNGGVGQFVVGSFVANSNNQSFTLTGVLPAGNNSAQLNAIQVRDLTATNLTAFPGAEGYGAMTTGGRGGSVYHVTTLADSGPGSFRDAVSVTKRTVVFDVGGIINLSNDVEVVDNITIAGQTAPGQGISTLGATVYLNHGFGSSNSLSHSNIIIRFMRFRQGYDQSGSGYSLALKPAHNIMLDHCSIEIGNWQTLSITYNTVTGEQPTDITVQNSIVGASVWHQLGVLSWNPLNLTFHHNLFVDNAARDPKVEKNMQVINDVVYNFDLGIYGDGTETVDFIGNYQINGPGTSGNSVNTGVNFQGTTGTYYSAGNFWDNNRNGKLDGVVLMPGTGSFVPNVSATQFCFPTIPVTVDSATQAFYKVLSQAGCSLNRDPLDIELVLQAQSLGTRAPGPDYYMKNTDPTNAWTGDPIPAWSITGGTASPDADQDGMSDEWEIAAGSDFANADNNIVDANGYTKLENYLNWLAAPHEKTTRNVTAADFDLWQITAPFTNQSPKYVVTNSLNGTTALISNRWARFSPATNFTGLASFTFAVTATNGPTMTNVVGVLVTPILPPTNLIWRGDGVANVWNLYFTNNWFNGASLQAFNGSDDVIFDDTGSNNTPVAITGALSPNSITVNATKNYTLGGSGSLAGNFALTKNNSGSLTLTTSNSFTGGIAVNGGTLIIASNASAAGTGMILLNGGALNEVTINIGNTISISGSNTWTISGSGNVSPSSDLTGSGTLILNPTCSGVFSPAGDWSGFTGIVAWAAGNGAICRFYGTLGSASAAFDLGNSTGQLFDHNGGVTIHLGALSGGPSTSLSGASTYSNSTTYVIGALGSNSTFSGKIADGTGDSALVKIGGGTLTLNGTNTFTGPTFVSNGTLLVNGSIASSIVTIASGAALAGAGRSGQPVTLQAGATLRVGANSNAFATMIFNSNLTIATGAKVEFDIGTNSDTVAVGGALSLGGSLTVNAAAGFGAGTYTLFAFSNTLSGSIAISNAPAGYRYAIATNVSGRVNLVVSKPRVTTMVASTNSLLLTGNFGMSASNYFLCAATNITLPPAQWLRIATNKFDASGNFAATNVVSTNYPQRYYMILMP